MFLNTNNLNEGASREPHEDGKKRELQEGQNPRTGSPAWQKAGIHACSNARWQKLRK